MWSISFWTKTASGMRGLPHATRAQGTFMNTRFFCIVSKTLLRATSRTKEVVLQNMAVLCIDKDFVVTQFFYLIIHSFFNFEKKVSPVFNCVNGWLFLLRKYVCVKYLSDFSLQWRHNERDGVSNHRRRYCLLTCLFRRRSKKTPTLRVTDLCAGNSLVTGEFPAQRASSAENMSIWWRHHVRDTSRYFVLCHPWLIHRQVPFTMPY